MRIPSKKYPLGFKGPLAFIQQSAASASQPNATPANGNEPLAKPDQSGMLQWLALGASLLALLVGLVNFALLIGALPIPIPGLRAAGVSVSKDTATYGFEFDNNGWLARGVAANAVSNNIRVFAGQGALEFQTTGITAQQQAFVYTTTPPGAKPLTKVIAHIYVPAGAPPLVATIYGLNSSYAWNSGPYIGLNAGGWTALAWQIPANEQTPVRELGVMIIGTAGSSPYSGPLYLDSVDLQKP